MDADFVDGVADNYKCTVCTLALQDPVLIVDCGHRLCKQCFQSLRDHADANACRLRCPQDRQEVNPDKVVDDIGTGRLVLDLRVYCNNKSKGCMWSGELRQLDDHVTKQCSVTSLKKFMEMVEMRLGKKDSEVAELQSNADKMAELHATSRDRIQNLELRISSQENEIENLQAQMCRRNHDMQQLQDELSSKSKEIVQMKRESDARIAWLENTLTETQGTLLEKEKEMALLKYELASDKVKSVMTFSEPKRRKLSNFPILPFLPTSGTEDNSIQYAETSSSTDHSDDVANVKLGVKELEKKTALLEFNLALMKEKYLQARNPTNRTEEQTNVKVNVHSTALDSAPCSSTQNNAQLIPSSGCDSDCAHCKGIMLLQKKVLNVASYIPGQSVVFVWRLRNYSYHENLDARVDSPRFYSELDGNGHCCLIRANWDNEDGALGFSIHTLKADWQPLSPFSKRIEISLTMGDKPRCSSVITKQDVKNRVDDLTIKPSFSMSNGIPFPHAFSPQIVAKCLKNDTLKVACLISNSDTASLLTP